MLTQKSYNLFKDYYAVTPCTFSVLHNGVNSNQFFIKYKLPIQSKEKLIFTWCSQDRPKKGLDFILKVWKILIKKHTNIELQIIGTNRKIDVLKTKVIGRIPNKELPKYLQNSDFYLFPTLCHEGFGLSLVEALKCGCYCIASNYGGVSEVLQDGKYGKLINNPNFIDEWVIEIDKSIEEYKSNNYQNPYIESYPKRLYDLEDWSTNMNTLINKAKLIL
ncbi:glycosyltransferase family 4 protein [Tenacibaculum aquimarinum]|uniref:glycosyltransferase family 4 protein n=1 Tax=Tenacibaculum aquimarinum TaxID=2910675 RepID=UPI001F0B253F|nr:glycosyltransferase family 4 protein [Tenacibaculum aquimarinum]MCH3884987.1 glycosyltransferase family 4 protein [Tenacibaculum aquimarinum]